MKKILVLGSTGMLGHMVLRVLSKKETFEVEGTQSEEPNAPYYFNVEDGIKEEFNNYDYLVNCIGVLSNAIDACDSNSVARAIRINALFPHELAKSVKGKIIHMSTDGVFSGKDGPYNEDSPHDCTDVYGKTKSLGEIDAPNVINIRTSIIGPSPYKKKGLLEWFLSQPDGATVQGYTNHVWNGVTTLQFAELCKTIIEENHFDKIRGESAVHHFCPNKPVSKYELLKIFKKISGKKIKIVPSEDKQFSAKRILDTKYDSLRNLFGKDRDIEVTIKDLYEWI